jgi:hypothetical protein
LLKTIKRLTKIIKRLTKINNAIEKKISSMFYNNVKAMSRRGDPMAKELYTELKTYFKKKKSDTEEPTDKALLRDAKAIAHGKKDGKIVIENISPHMTGGVHKVVDDVHKGKASFKESERGEIEE